MIVQTDKADLAPAVLYLLFDARDSSQSKSKATALNFGDGAGFVHTALEVVLGGFTFTALGHETETPLDGGRGRSGRGSGVVGRRPARHRANLRAGRLRRLRAADRDCLGQSSGPRAGNVAAFAAAERLRRARRPVDPEGR